MKATIVHQLSGKEIPLDFLHVMAKNNRRGIGFVHFNSGVMKVNPIAGAIDAEKIFAAQQKFLDGDKYWWFADLPQNYLEADLQPFVLQVGENLSPLIVGLLEGDFSKYYDKDTGHVDAYNVAEKILKPKIAQFYGLTKGDLNAVYEALSANHIGEEIGNTIDSNGSVVLVFANGKDLKFVKRPEIRSLDFGWVSNTYGWGKAPATPMDMGAFLKEAAAPIIGATKVLTDFVTSKDKDENDPTKLQFYLKNFNKVKPPSDTRRSRHVKAWYRKNAGFLPDNWEERPSVYLLSDRKKAEQQLKTHLTKVGKAATSTETAVGAAMAAANGGEPLHLPDKPEVVEEAKPTPKPMSASERRKAALAAKAAEKEDLSHEKPPTVEEPEPKPKDVEPHNIPQPDDKGVYHLTPKHTGNEISIEDLPIVPPEDKVALRDFGKVHGDGNGEEMPDPDELQEEEKKIPNSFEHLGFKGPTPTYRWKYPRFKQIGQKYPDFLAIMAMNYRNNEIRAKILLAEAQAEISRLKSQIGSQPMSASERARLRVAQQRA